MKIAAAAITTVLVALAMQQESVAAANCLAACQSEVMTHQVTDCTVWRERLPRPDLYSLCQDGYDLGLSAGCAGYCASDVDESRLASLRLDACTFLRGTPPMDRMRACQSGFSSAVKRSKTAAANKRDAVALEVVDSDTATESTTTTTEEQPPPKKKVVSVKKAPEARNILELAREEAQAAFQTDTRATEL
ncbi:hypothetical protein Gpo141_00000903 [Globisporangium polare]